MTYPPSGSHAEVYRWSSAFASFTIELSRLELEILPYQSSVITVFTTILWRCMALGLTSKRGTSSIVVPTANARALVPLHQAICENRTRLWTLATSRNIHYTNTACARDQPLPSYAPAHLLNLVEASTKGLDGIRTRTLSLEGSDANPLNTTNPYELHSIQLEIGMSSYWAL